MKPEHLPPATDEDHTFMFADIAGFTALTEAHGDDEAADLALEFAAKVRDWLTTVGGGDLKLIGDATMVRTTEAAAALELALLIVEGLEDLGNYADYPAARIGMTTGPAASRDGDWFGATVNLAARVAAHASGGEILATEATRRAVGDEGAVEWEQLGERTFRNVRDPVHIFRASRPGATPAVFVIDPACRMRLDPNRAAAMLRHHNTEYSFCSLACANAFVDNPRAYLG